MIIDLLSHGIVRTLQLESPLKGMRYQLLERVLGGAPHSEMDIKLAEAMTRHSFSTEYVWAITEAEDRKLDVLQNHIVQTIARGSAVNGFQFFVLGAYRDLFEIPAIQNWVLSVFQHSPDSVDETLKLIVLDRLTEAALAQKLPALTEIENDTSRSVRAQYEENPYPRWRTLEPHTPQIYTDVIAANLGVDAQTLQARVPEPHVLVAGCGTGRHPIKCATVYKDSQVVAVDLSRRSLAYATREAHQRGVQNVSFAQADILQLAALGPCFDVVESSGVIHHMAEPEKGLSNLLAVLKPGGYLKLGLYSRLARQHVHVARTVIAERGYAADLNGIRQFRKDYIEGDFQNVEHLEEVGDFYTTSELRDLVFHVQEHVYDLRQIKHMLEAHGLEFLGFLNTRNNFKADYAAEYPDDPAQRNLENWAEFEEAHTKTFTGMYQFWCQKPFNT